MFDIGDNLVARGTLLGYAVFSLLVIWMVGKTYARSGGALIPTVITGLTGGLALWFAYNSLAVRDAFDRDFGAAGGVVIDASRVVAAHVGIV